MGFLENGIWVNLVFGNWYSGKRVFLGYERMGFRKIGFWENDTLINWDNVIW